MVKRSHETPLSLLDASLKWNDYDYALVHLFTKYPTYYEFFEKSLKNGRMVILDNSIFELGKAFQADEFAKWIKKLHPTEYIVPDCLEDSKVTMAQFANWISKYTNLPGKKIGVVQGKTYEELVECYTYMSLNADKIAISFDYSFYSIISTGNKWEKFASGRERFIHMLISDGIWDYTKPHHLLGAALPQEFKTYATLGWNTLNIESLDTSNPVQQGLLGHSYTDDGLNTKDTLKICDSFEATYPDELIKIADHNVHKFKYFCEYNLI